MMKKVNLRYTICALTLLLVLGMVQPVLALSGGPIHRVSIASDGTEANDNSNYAAISDNGRYIVFSSEASNLVPDDTNGDQDIFVHDRQTGATERVSVASDGTQANNDSYSPVITADGRFIAFASHASNLVVGDTNNHLDVFIHDRQTDTTERVSVASGGTQANGTSNDPAITDDGRYVAFFSYATNLVVGDTNLCYDIFLHDRQTGVTERISIASDGTQTNGNALGPAITPDGRYVVFYSAASNLAHGDTNNEWDIFVHDRQTSVTERISVASDGTQANGASLASDISENGRYVVFESLASNLVVGDTNIYNDIFVHDRQTGATERVSVASDGTQANNDSYSPVITTDGRYIAFASYASNLVPGDSNNHLDVFIHDCQTSATERVSVASDGTQANGFSNEPAITGDGRFVTFTSYASNLAPGDTNGFADIFVKDLWTETFLPLTVK